MRSVCEHLLTSGNKGSTVQDGVTPQITASRTQHFYSLCYSSDSSIIYPDYLFMFYFQGQPASLDRVIIVSRLYSPPALVPPFTWYLATVHVLTLALTREASHLTQPITGDQPPSVPSPTPLKGSDKGRIERAQPKMTAKSQTLTDRSTENFPRQLNQTRFSGHLYKLRKLNQFRQISLLPGEKARAVH